jgi:hypothetical protein
VVVCPRIGNKRRRREPFGSGARILTFDETLSALIGIANYATVGALTSRLRRSAGHSADDEKRRA